MKNCTATPARQSGISYIEVLIAVLLIVMTLVPMMDAMLGATGSVVAHEDAAVRHAHLAAKMEDVLGEPYSSLEAAAIAATQGNGSSTNPSSYTDQAGAINRRLVFLSFYDGDNADADDDPFSDMEMDLMWVRVEIEGTQIAVETLVYR